MIKKILSTHYYWIAISAILIIGRISLLCSLYFFKNPFGGPVVENVNKFLWHSIYVESGVVMALMTCFILASFWIRGKGLTVLKAFIVILGSLYVITSGIDDEVQRWMFQKFTPSFISVYLTAFADTSIVLDVFSGDVFHFILTIVLCSLFSALLAIVTVKADFRQIMQRPLKKNQLMVFAISFLLAVVGCTSFWWFNPLPRRQVRIKPVFYSFVSEFISTLDARHAPDNYREGVIALGGNPDVEYPFWKKAENEIQSLENFKRKSFDEKPDIILFTIESLRGWTSDMRIGSSCKTFPHLCKLALEGLYFPNTHSVGAPSIEGLLGIMEGILSHPYVVFLNNYPTTRMKSISEILREAGYHTEVLMGTDPRFANEEVWFKQWFDYVEFIDNSNDVTLANRFIEHYKERPEGKPLFYHWMSRSMHVPFKLPKDMGPTPDDPAVAYMRAAVYMDSALGIIMNTVENSPRANNTLFILTGDHSFPTGKQAQLAEKLGKINDGHSWVSLIFKGPNIKPQLETQQVSQADIAPSILGYLNLDVSNHFMGIDLLSERDSLSTKKLPSVFSFEYGDMGMWEDSMTYYLSPIHGDNRAVALKTYMEPAWDTTQLVDGFVQAAPIEISAEELEAKTRTMRAVADTWKYLIYKNKLMPPADRND